MTPPALPPSPPRRVGLLGALFATVLLMAFAWVVWVAGAIMYSYGVEVIAWATRP